MPCSRNRRGDISAGVSGVATDWLPGFLEAPVDDLGDHTQHVLLDVDDLHVPDQPVESLDGGEHAKEFIGVRVRQGFDGGKIDDDLVAG